MCHVIPPPSDVHLTCMCVGGTWRSHVTSVHTHLFVPLPDRTSWPSSHTCPQTAQHCAYTITKTRHEPCTHTRSCCVAGRAHGRTHLFAPRPNCTVWPSYAYTDGATLRSHPLIKATACILHSHMFLLRGWPNTRVHAQSLGSDFQTPCGERGSLAPSV
jgi:hypothetical protein